MPLLAKQKPRAPAAAVGRLPAPAPRRGRCGRCRAAAGGVDGRDFWDSKRVFGAACNCDYARLCKEQRYWKFIERNDDDARSAEAVQAEMNEIKAVFAARYGALLRMFDYYCCVGGQVGRGAFAISENAFLDLCKKCAIPDPHCTVEDIGKIFIVVNFETDKKSADADVNEDKALMRHELLECFVRIAVAKYINGSKELDDVSEAVDRLLCVIFDDERAGDEKS